MPTPQTNEPYTAAAAVTPSDSNPLPIANPCKALYVGGAGALAVRMARAQNNVTFSAVPAGTLLPIEADRVLSTGTTATNIVALG